MHAEQEALLADLPEARIHTPTAQEWADPVAYIRGIQAQSNEDGIAVIRSPLAPALSAGEVLASLPGFRFNTRVQALGRQSWQAWDGVQYEEGAGEYTLEEFASRADASAAQVCGGVAATLPTRTLERMYWALQSAPPSGARVEYGSDVEGTAFHAKDPLGGSRWNLGTLPRELGCLLRHCERPVPGVSSPMLYIGGLFSTFAWHVEDQHLYSINYAHQGAPKVWYGVPGAQADAFEALAAASVYAGVPLADPGGQEEGEDRGQAGKGLAAEGGLGAKGGEAGGGRLECGAALADKAQADKAEILKTEAVRTAHARMQGARCAAAAAALTRKTTMFPPWCPGVLAPDGPGYEGGVPPEARDPPAPSTPVKTSSPAAPCRPSPAPAVRVVRAVQHPGDYVVTFPRAYHAGFSAGLHVGEAVNLALAEWWPWGAAAREEYRAACRAEVVSFEGVLCASALEELPGTAGGASDEATATLRRAFLQHMRARLGERRALAAAGLPSARLSPGQWARVSDAACCARCAVTSSLALVVGAVPDALCMQCAAAMPAHGLRSRAAWIMVTPEWGRCLALAAELDGVGQGTCANTAGRCGKETPQALPPPTFWEPLQEAGGLDAKAEAAVMQLALAATIGVDIDPEDPDSDVHM